MNPEMVEVLNQYLESVKEQILNPDKMDYCGLGVKLRQELVLSYPILEGVTLPMKEQICNLYGVYFWMPLYYN